MITFDKLKRLTITALVADEYLMSILVLKGGNAIEIAYDLTSRGSIDIDFSMEGDFSETHRTKIEAQIRGLLENEFQHEGLQVFDVKLSARPQVMVDAVKSFWGGYALEFKVISSDRYEQLKGNSVAIQREALPIMPNGSSKFTVDISKHEYIKGKQPIDLEGSTVFVYTPEMIILEKLRALCQQVEDYKDIIGRYHPKSRARDFYDIHNLATSFSINIKSSENLELCRHIFNSKMVDLSYIDQIAGMREFHRQSWQSVIDTVNVSENLQPFDYYFDFVITLFQDWAAADIPLGT